SLVSPGTSVAYRDAQAVVQYRLNKNDTLSLLTFGAFDLAGDTKDNGDKETLFASEFYRADFRYDHALANGGTARLATAFGLDRSRLSGNRFARDFMIQPRATLLTPLAAGLTLRTGLDATIDVINAD